MGIIPEPGQVVRVRTRTYLVESAEATVNEPSKTNLGTVVRLACLDDDAQGQLLEVLWELELDAEILDREAWQQIGQRGFDPPRHFGAYIHTLRWNCVTATDPKLFQSPFRAGIKLDAYQLEPLRKALLLPRVNLFIADDVGLGKTIEAGLIASELLLRRRIREIVVACPPSMLPQWRDELEARFGLTFEILDREYLRRVREERGYSVNPWTTFPRFLVSHNLLIDEDYKGPLVAWLEELRPGSLLIFDEAHHAAPASGAKYAIDSRLTRAVRDIAPRFEHRLFLSATPHNGHSNSFASLLNILDPQRFLRGVKVRAKDLDPVMVRRLKEDIREIAGGFPKRVVRQVDISGLPNDAPELALSRLLDQYRQVRQARMAGASKRQQAEAALLVSGLQQRLLSSVEAFARTLAVHRRTMERHWAADQAAVGQPLAVIESQLEVISNAPDADTDRAELSDDDLDALESEAFAAATESTLGDSTRANIAAERALLSQMQALADAARAAPDGRIRKLVEWIAAHMCSGAHLPGAPSPQHGAKWADMRLLIFTEYEDTRRYLVEMLRTAIDGSDRAEERIEFYHGPTSPERREQIKRAFNAPPAEHPVRILVATDAAREGLNLQAHCANLFHFDVPWNPSRLEQRNGRIDRKLQPEPEVFCHYFVYTQRPEDRVLRALVKKTDRIRQELGSLSDVLEKRLSEMVKHGIIHADSEQLARDITAVSPDAAQQALTDEELEQIRERQERLQQSIDGLRNRLNDARKWIGFDQEQFRDALSCSLEMLGAEALRPTAGANGGPPRFEFPNLSARHGADPTWTATLDTLRALPEDGRRDWEWRKDAPIRPVVFDAPEGIDDDVVQLHLEHRVAQRLLGRFRSQGYVYHDLSRACLAQTVDAIPRVVLLGRLSLYGKGAARLHEELIVVAARWIEQSVRRGPLSPYGRDAEARTLDLLEQALRPGVKAAVAPVVAERLHTSIPQDIEALLPSLERRGLAARVDAEKQLSARGQAEAAAIHKLLEDQKQRARAADQHADALQLTLVDDNNEAEIRQLASDRRSWLAFLARADADIATEPQRIREFYAVSSARLEPVGLAYLWPVSG
jgi:superfamily II DNA or RNA helicase